MINTHYNSTVGGGHASVLTELEKPKKRNKDLAKQI